MNTRSEHMKELLESFELMRKRLPFPKVSGEMSQITPSQWAVLRILEDQKTSTVKEVAKTMGISSSAATQLIDVLVRGKHVVREESKTDRRSVHLTLSKKTKTHVAEMKGRIMAELVNLFKSLCDAEFKSYVTLSKKIASTGIGK